MPFFNLPGLELEFDWHGPGPAETTTIVMLHGGLGSLAAWGDYPSQIAASTGCGVFVYSRMGYGRSHPAPLPRPVSFMHDEALIHLPKILSSFDIRNAVLLGHSDG